MTHHYLADGIECEPHYGTGFLVEFPTGDGRLGLVTNRHLADLTFREDEPENEGTVLKSALVQWWQSKNLRCEHTITQPEPLYHPDPLIDVAIIPIVPKNDAPPIAVAEYFGDLAKFIATNSSIEITLEHAISWANLLECEMLWPQLEPGVLVAFPGYPLWYDRLQIRPVMRSGLIASDPQTDYRSGEGDPTRKDSSHQVLFDAFSTNGSSGSPVFASQRGMPPIKFLVPNGGGRTAVESEFGTRNYYRSFLIGINASHYNDSGIPRPNEHVGLSRLHKLSVIMDILRQNQAPHTSDARRMEIRIRIPDEMRRNPSKAVRDKQILILHQEGKTQRAIATEVGCSPSTVGRVLNRSGANNSKQV